MQRTCLSYEPVRRAADVSCGADVMHCARVAANRADAHRCSYLRRTRASWMSDWMENRLCALLTSWGTILTATRRPGSARRTRTRGCRARCSPSPPARRRSRVCTAPPSPPRPPSRGRTRSWCAAACARVSGRSPTRAAFLRAAPTLSTLKGMPGAQGRGGRALQHCELRAKAVSMRACSCWGWGSARRWLMRCQVPLLGPPRSRCHHKCSCRAGGRERR